MANEMARRQPSRPSLPRSFVMPDFPKDVPVALLRAVTTILNPHPDIPMPKTWPADVRQGARQALALLTPLCEPATEEAVAAFLWPVADAVEFTPPEDEFFRRVRALWMAAEEVPHVAFTREAQLSGMRTWPRMPSVSAVLDLVLPPIFPLVTRRRALRMIAVSED